MKKKFSVLFVLLSIFFAFTYCSEVDDQISTPEEFEGIHPEGFGKIDSENFHTKKIQENLWDLSECQKCHASNYSGGVTGISCLDCHTSEAGPEACNTCHGDFSDGNRIAPPKDLSGNTTTDSPGVGAHQSHLSDNELRIAIPCAECHTVPNNFNDPIHIDGNPNAELMFGPLATNLGANPSFSFETLKCSNNYCHGKFAFKKEDSDNQWAYTDSLITGENFSPKWTKVDDTQAACGTCHLLPPTGHLNANTDPDAVTCRGCHPAAFNEDGTLNETTHINGEKDLN